MKNKQFNLVIRVLFLVLFLTLAGVLTCSYMPQLSALAKEPARFRDLLLAYGSWSQAAFIILQILQVVAAPLPGEIIQVAGGYVYGVLGGTMLSLTGILLGSLAAFFLCRWLGYPLLLTFIKPEKAERWRLIINTNRAEMVIFLVFLIPGAPKDILTFIAGITPIKPGNFFLAAMLGRFPGILVSAVIGAQLEHHQYFLAAILSLAAALLCLLGFLYRDRFMTFLRHKQSKV